jgi:hypothetical protein
MIWLILLLVYAAHIFLTRWINKLCYKIDDCTPVLFLVWLIPIAGLISFIVIYFKILSEKGEFGTWFTGKNWK